MAVLATAYRPEPAAGPEAKTAGCPKARSPLPIRQKRHYRWQAKAVLGCEASAGEDEHQLTWESSQRARQVKVTITVSIQYWERTASLGSA